MKNNKLFKWLYGIFMFLPMLAIGVCCAYVTFNKNAKDSYYGDTINQREYIQDNNYVIGNTYYYLQPTALTYSSALQYDIFVENVINISTNISYQVTKMTFYSSNNEIYLQMYNGSNFVVGYTLTNNGQSIKFDYLASSTSIGNYSQISNNIYREEYNKYSYLDNAFYYAIDKFNECGFNKVDFVSFFDFFNTQNNIYITFVNTYINYMLFVSLAFFIPRVLMWFVGFAYGLTDSYSGRSLW